MNDPHVVAESPEEVVSPPGFSLALDNNEFQTHVDAIMNAIEDPEKYRRCIAEIHAYLALFDKGLRQMQQEMLENGGPIAMFKMMFGRKS